MKSLCLLSVALGLFLVAPSGNAAPGPKDEKADLKKFEGNWIFASWDSNGQSLPQEFLDSCKWSVKGDKYTFEQGENKEEGSIKIDPSKKPATIDLDITSGNDKGKAQPGIYKIDGETITVCLARPGEKGHILVTLKRAK